MGIDSTTGASDTDPLITNYDDVKKDTYVEPKQASSGCFSWIRQCFCPSSREESYNTIAGAQIPLEDSWAKKACVHLCSKTSQHLLWGVVECTVSITALATWIGLCIGKDMCGLGHPSFVLLSALAFEVPLSHLTIELIHRAGQFYLEHHAQLRAERKEEKETSVV